MGKSQEFESAHPPNPTGFQGAPLVYAKNSRVSPSQLASGRTGGKGSQTPIKWIGCGSCWASTPKFVPLCTWNPNDPCFDWKRPSLGRFNFQNRGQTGSRYLKHKGYRAKEVIFREQSARVLGTL